MIDRKFIKLHEDATVPTRATKGSAGYDLHALCGGTIPSGERLLIKTGIAWNVQDGYVGFIKPRSGLAYKFGIDVMAGVIDSDYEGDIGVILFNTDENDFEFNAGDRIAQLVILPFESFASDHIESKRHGGFGSTGTIKIEDNRYGFSRAS